MKKIYTSSAPAAIGPYSQAVEAGGVIYSSGQIAIVPETGNIEATDIQGQTKQVMENLKSILLAAGSSFDEVVKTTCFLCDISDFNEFNQVYETYITNKPARSCVAVDSLPKGALVEVEVVAVVGKAST